MSDPLDFRPFPDPTIVGWLDEEMAELSRLHLAYENAALDHDVYSEEAIDTAAALSAAVGKFLVIRGYEGRI